jgi:hypothetical protein
VWAVWTVSLGWGAADVGVGAVWGSGGVGVVVLGLLVCMFVRVCESVCVYMCMHAYRDTCI